MTRQDFQSVATDVAITRRDALRLACAAAMGIYVDACKSAPATDAPRSVTGRLAARPSAPKLSPSMGRSSLGIADGRDGILYVPTTYNPNSPAPLALMLHGAGQSSE